jgi:hypothetical protein
MIVPLCGRQDANACRSERRGSTARGAETDLLCGVVHCLSDIMGKDNAVQFTVDFGSVATPPSTVCSETPRRRARPRGSVT